MLQMRREDGILIAAFGPVADRCQRDDLAEALAELSQALLLEEEIRVVVLEGTTGEAFAMPEAAWTEPIDEEGGLPEGGVLPLAEPLASLEVPVIAAIEGDCLGPGLELALACDVRIAAEQTRFALPQIRKGRLPCDGGTQRLLRLVGRGKALEMVLTGQPVAAQEALAIGLANRIVPADAVKAAALALAREMAAQAPVSLRYIKEAVREGTEMTLSQGLRLEADLYMLLQTTRDRETGIGAFQRREKPRFAGR